MLPIVKKKIRWILPVVGLISFALILIQWNQSQESFEPTPSYDVQMVDELYYTDDSIKQWVDETCSVAGSYEKKIGSYQHLLICGGVQTEERYALALVDTKTLNHQIEVIYSLVKVEGEEYTEGMKSPFMIVRIPNNPNLTLKAKQISEDAIPEYLTSKSN